VSTFVAIFWSDLARHVYRKLLLVIPLLIGVVTLLFLLIELAPGTPIDVMIGPNTPKSTIDVLVHKWHLDEPIWVRYGYMLRNVFLLDFGDSISTGQPVMNQIRERLPNTLLLSTVTLTVLYPLGLALGTIQAIRHRRVEDTAISLGTLFLYSMPSFFLALGLQIVFAMRLDLVPLDAMHDAMWWDDMSTYERVIDVAKHLVLPGAAIGVASAAGVARYMRSSLLEVVGQDYIRTARAKGLSEWRVIGRHALRNALLPIITLFSLSLPFLFSGSVIVETIFSWPGMGRLIYDAIMQQDTPVVIGCFYIYALIVAFAALLADIAFAFADPRIRFAG
jgi:peptide/nickel transport system permease protein